MKILHIINTLATGGAQSALIQLIKNWGEPHDQQMVISLRQYEPLSGEVEALNVSVKHINLLSNTIDAGKFLKLAHIIKNYQPDVIQTWLYHSDLIGSIAARLVSRAPIIWGIHHTTTNKDSVKSSTWSIIRILSWLSTYLPSQIICCSESAFRSHIDLGYPENRMTTIVNGVDTDYFRPDPMAHEHLQAKLGLSRQTKLIGMFARFHPQKDHNTLIKAAGIILKTNPNIHFILAGEGIDTSNTQLRDKLFLEGIKANFHLLGARRDMSLLNAGMDIVTLSSSYGEALPMTLCEAMSCAIPSVATNIGDATTLIGATGLVVEPGEPQALADAWQNILDRSDMEYNLLAFQARQRILEFYNVADMIKKYKLIYRELKKA